MWQYAHDAGMRVYLGTDMLALSTPLQGYVDEHGLDAEDPELWKIYAAGLEELLAEICYVDGLMIRIVATALALRSAYGFTRRGSVGRVLIAAGVPVVLGGAGVAMMGTERALTVWNDQMALIP